MRTVSLIFALLATPVAAAEHQFCWVGAAGYSMTGTIAYPDALQDSGVITHTELTAFRIEGFLFGHSVGTWDMANWTPSTTFELYFDTSKLAFPMGGHRREQSYQAWNADGYANNCGKGGFGFNGGSRAQDVCIDNTFIDESGVPPATPLPILQNAVALCGEGPVS